MPGLPLTLVYDAPVECPTQDALRAAVENLVTSDPARPLAVHVAISKVGNSYRASITSPGGSARVLSGSTCSEVVEGTSVVLALAVTPQARAASARGTLTSAATPPAPVAARETHGIIGAAVTGDVGSLPHATLGFGGQLEVERRHWAAYVAGTYWLRARGTLPNEPGLGGDFSWWTGAAGVCGASATGVLRLDVCVGPELGVLSAVGIGALSPRQSPSTVWGALTANVGASWAISIGFRLHAAVGVAVPFVGRRPFTLDAVPVHEPAAVAARAEAGPEIVF